ncbi:hypothetical protein [Alicyclobacillus sp. SO9]|uniref:hypothetical protein n=1 Tax=Alicyclobacillus sp. SO9 TaxID=2665646 RepID=UPI0018E7C6BB|nr:hypothetical protein [Alicyclobacillus sp. SO9]QQE77272.1 hypothetical protein GI364_15030 [Alicyclobacillus sp. SO9]
MSSTRGPVPTLEGVENVIWFGKHTDRKDRHSQWMDPEFRRLWEGALQEAFEIAGTPAQYTRMHRHSDVGGNCPLGPTGFVPIRGLTNSQFLRDSLLKDGCSFDHLESAVLSDGVVVYYVGSREEGLKDWEMTLVAAELGTIKYWSSRELTAYVQGLRDGYPSDIGYLYCRENKIEIPLNAELAWTIVVDGNRFNIDAAWDEVVRTYRSTRQNVIDLVRPQIDSHVRALTWKVQ